MAAADVPSILLKGAAIANWLYNDGSVRPYSDVDLLVSPSNFRRAIALLDTLGYRPMIPGAHPSELGPKELDLVGPNGVAIDLHNGLIGASAPPERCWEILASRTVSMRIGGAVELNVLDVPARAMHLALHAAQNGPIDTKAIADLQRGLAMLARADWEAASRVADAIGAQEAFAAGLRLLPAGRVLADELDLTHRMNTELVLRTRSATQHALFFERLNATGGAAEKLALLARKLFPTADALRLNSRIASRGRLGMIAAWAAHPFSVAVRLGPAFVAWRQARRDASVARAPRSTQPDRAPHVAFVTMSRWGIVYPRIGRWLGVGFREIGVPADIVFLEGPESVIVDGSVHEVKLGVRRARSGLLTLAAYLRDRKPAVTLATPGPIGSLAVLAGIFTGSPVVPWVSTIPRLDNNDVPLYMRPHRVLSHRLYRRAPFVAAVSTGVRDALAVDLAPSVRPERIVLIPNPVDVDEVRRRADPPAPRRGRLRFCSVGRLVSAKGFDILIEAFSLASLDQPWELLIIGDGPLRSQLRRLIQKHGLEAHIELLGSLENPYPLIASSDVAVQASRWEGFGMAILEALALGVAQIATDCPGGVAETLGYGEHGILVPPGDPVALARALELLATDVRLRGSLAARGPSRAADFAPARVADIVVRMAQEVSSEPCSGAARPRRRTSSHTVASTGRR